MEMEDRYNNNIEIYIQEYNRNRNDIKIQEGNRHRNI